MVKIRILSLGLTRHKSALPNPSAWLIRNKVTGSGPRQVGHSRRMAALDAAGAAETAGAE